MANPTRYLTKSRFKLATECPRKLFYSGKSQEYLDTSLSDSFLAALAEGGYQVGELACLMYPGGVRIDELDHDIALQKTNDLLRNDKAIIYEAALAVGELFVRVDVLIKDGRRIELLEVKAKSYSAAEDKDFRGASGRLKAEFLPYLFDIAFQRFVASKALPDFDIHAFLVLVDKEASSTVDGLNQLFPVVREGRRLRINTVPGTSTDSLGGSLLAKVLVDDQVDQLLRQSIAVGPAQTLSFPDAVQYFAKAYANDSPIDPSPSARCSSCEFKASSLPEAAQPKSGFHECWSQAFNWKRADFESGTVLDLWNFRGKDTLIESKTLKLSQVTKQDLDFDGQPPWLTGLTRKHRQWYSCNPDWPGGGEYFFHREGFRKAKEAWRFPLHFIDFETSTVAIPFLKGRRPYETTAFQFSHHVLQENGEVTHLHQWLEDTPGVDPNMGFLRALRNALSSDEGTIFRWAPHENTVLNHLRSQLLALEPPADANELISFIDGITTRKDGKGDIMGVRNMVDLCAIADSFYFHPSTKGSSSLKKVLPALMNSSSFLRNSYGEANYSKPRSKNFETPIAWWQLKDGEVVDPYSLLPPVFQDISAEEVLAAEEGLSPELREGGAAMAAYARLQFETLSPETRSAIRDALFRYCELDTLAMVMAFQAWDAEASS